LDCFRPWCGTPIRYHNDIRRQAQHHFLLQLYRPDELRFTGDIEAAGELYHLVDQGLCSRGVASRGMVQHARSLASTNPLRHRIDAATHVVAQTLGLWHRADGCTQGAEIVHHLPERRVLLKADDRNIGCDQQPHGFRSRVAGHQDEIGLQGEQGLDLGRDPGYRRWDHPYDIRNGRIINQICHAGQALGRHQGSEHVIARQNRGGDALRGSGYGLRRPGRINQSLWKVIALDASGLKQVVAQERHACRTAV
jgi:hypothetical protein